MTLRNLFEMAQGKLEMLGMTKGKGKGSVLPYDPRVFQ